MADVITFIKSGNPVHISSIANTFGSNLLPATYEIDQQSEYDPFANAMDNRLDEYPVEVTQSGDFYTIDNRVILFSGDVTGGGGGGDADTLQGQAGSYYRNYANFTGTAVIVSGNSFFASSQLAGATISGGTITATTRVNSNIYSGQVMYLDSMFSGSMAEFRGQVNVASNINATAFVACGATSALIHTGRSRIYSSADGKHNVINSSLNGYTGFTFGPETVAFPYLKVNNSGLILRTGSDSANSPFEALDISGSVSVRSPSGQFSSLRIVTGSSSSNFTVGGDLSTTNMLATGYGRVASTSYYEFNSRSRIYSTADGALSFTKNDDTAPSLFIFGPASSSTTALKLNSTTGLIVRAGDDSVNKSLEALNLSGSVSVISPSGSFTVIRVTGGSSFGSTLDVAGTFTGGVGVYAGASSPFGFTGRSLISSAADGRISLTTNANNSFTRITFGPENIGSPALKTNQSGLLLVNGADTFRTDLGLRTLNYSGTVTQEFVNGTKAGAYTIDWSTLNNHTIGLSGSLTTLTFTAPSGPTRLQLVVTQNTVSGTIAWPATVKWPAGAAPTLTPTSGSIDMIAFWYNGTNYLGTYAQNFV